MNFPDGQAGACLGPSESSVLPTIGCESEEGECTQRSTQGADVSQNLSPEEGRRNSFTFYTFSIPTSTLLLPSFCREWVRINLSQLWKFRSPWPVIVLEWPWDLILTRDVQKLCWEDSPPKLQGKSLPTAFLIAWNGNVVFEAMEATLWQEERGYDKTIWERDTLGPW